MIYHFLIYLFFLPNMACFFWPSGFPELTAKASVAKVQEWVNELNDEATKGNYEDWANQYSDDAIILPDHDKVITGNQVLKRLLGGTMLWECPPGNITLVSPEEWRNSLKQHSPYISVGGFGIIGNLFVIFSIGREQDKEIRGNYMLIAALAVSDTRVLQCWMLAFGQRCTGHPQDQIEEKVFTSDEMETPYAGNHYPVRTPLANGPPPKFAPRITQQNSLQNLRRPVAPMTFDPTDATGTDQESTAPSLVNQPLPPTPKTKYKETDHHWNGQYLMNAESGAKMSGLAPWWMSIFFCAAAIVCFMANCIPLIVSTWKTQWQIEFTSSFYSAQLGYYVLLIALGVSIWHSTIWQYPMFVCTVATILAFRLPTIIIGLVAAVQFLGFYTGTEFSDPANQFGSVIDPFRTTRKDHIPTVQVLIAVFLVELILDIFLLIISVYCIRKNRSYDSLSSKCRSFVIILMACLAACFDILPQHVFIVEATIAIEPEDNFFARANTNIQTGGVVNPVGQGFNNDRHGSRAACRNVFQPYPTTIWQHFVGSISPYFFTIFVVFLAVAPSYKRHNGSYASLVHTVACVCFVVMTIAQIAMLISRSYTMNKIMDTKAKADFETVPYPTYADCIERLVISMIVSRVFVLLLCLGIGILLLIHAWSGPKINSYPINKQ